MCFVRSITGTNKPIKLKRIKKKKDSACKSIKNKVKKRTELGKLTMHLYFFQQESSILVWLFGSAVIDVRSYLSYALFSPPLFQSLLYRY